MDGYPRRYPRPSSDQNQRGSAVRLDRRSWGRVTLSGVLGALAISRTRAGGEEPATGTREQLQDRIRGLLLGTLAGDAGGGPVEFKPVEELRRLLPDVRSWSAAETTEALRSGRLAKSFSLLPYEGIRSEPEPYAHWTRDGAPGTVTDDSRHKMVLMHALERCRRQPDRPLEPQHLAQAYLDFPARPAIARRPEYRALCEEGFHEYTFASRWQLGERNQARARPIDRLWGGAETCWGQMALLPLAALYPGDPEAAYRASYAIGFCDLGAAKDINSALVAGLAAAIRPPNTAQKREHVWQHVARTMRDVDPYQYAQIPFMTRPAVFYLDLAEDIVRRSEGRPARLFELLEQDGRPIFWWDSHFIHVVSWATLVFCQFDGLAALSLCLAFGHDTDSAAQVVGALAGAVHGSGLFPAEMQQQIVDRLEADYGEVLDDWVALLVELSDRQRYPAPIKNL